jgi:hypothetical protein
VAVQEDTCAAAGCVICKALSNKEMLTPRMRHRRWGRIDPIIQHPKSRREASPQFSLKTAIVMYFLHSTSSPIASACRKVRSATSNRSSVAEHVGWHTGTEVTPVAGRLSPRGHRRGPENGVNGSPERGFQGAAKSQLTTDESPACDRIAFALCPPRNRTARMPSGEKAGQ